MTTPAPDPAALLLALAWRGVSVVAEGGRLRVDAPRRTCTAADREALAAAKAEVLALLDPSPRVWPIDWREEHRLEIAWLSRKIASTADPALRRQLRDLTAESVVDTASLIRWGKRLVRLAAALDGAGPDPAGTASVQGSDESGTDDRGDAWEG